MKLGVFGGTFNPIHLGHLHLAQHTRQLFGLTDVHFVVATTPPHKPLEDVVPFIHRYTMVGLATAAVPCFIPSLVELDRPTSPFSLHTMEKFARRHVGSTAVLHFIAGGDSLLEVAGWHESEELLSSYNFIFVARKGAAAPDAGTALPPGIARRIRDLRELGLHELGQRIRAEESSQENRIYIIDVGTPDISASQIRRLISAGERIDHLVPASVDQYIHKLHLYGER